MRKSVKKHGFFLKKSCKRLFKTIYRSQRISIFIILSGAQTLFPTYAADFTSTVRGNFTFTEDSTVTTSAANAYGLYTLEGTRITSDYALIVRTQGQNASGVKTLGGNIYLKDIDISTTGKYAAGIVAATTGSVTTVNSTGEARISTAGDYASGVRSSQNSYINLNNVEVTTTGYNSAGLYATGSSGISVSGTAVVRTSGDDSTGIYSNTSSFSMQTGNITLADIHVTTSGARSHGVVNYGGDSDIKLEGGDIQTSGPQSHGFMVQGGATKTFDGQSGKILPSITVSGAGSAALASSGAGSQLTLSGNTALTMASTAGVDTWGGLAIDGGALIFQGQSSTGGTRLWVTDSRSSLTLDDNANAGGSLIRLDDGTLYMGSDSQAGAISGTTGSVVSALAQGGTVNLGSNNTANDGSLTDNADFAGAFKDVGLLKKTGDLTQILSGSGNTVGQTEVAGGALRFGQAGVFTTTGDYRTLTGATTDIGLANSTLQVGGAFIQDAGSALKVTIGSGPDISAGTARLDGHLDIDGFTDSEPPVKASDIANNTYTVIHTTNGITGDFDNNPLTSTGLDYLLYDGHLSTDGMDYNLGFRLAWNEGLQGKGTGSFTLDAGTAFDIDTVLADQTVPPGGFQSGWDGSSLTKDGNGLLILSAVNTYTGTTTLRDGILRTDVDDSIAASNALTVNGGVFDLNGNNQHINRLSGSGGKVELNGAMLTVNNATEADSTTFDGDIVTGSMPGGRLAKIGTGALTLTGKTAWTGDTYLDGGVLILDGVTGGAQLISNIIGQDNTALSLRNGATLTGRIDPTDVSIDAASTWNMTEDSQVNTLNLAGKLSIAAPLSLPMATGHTLTAMDWNGQNGTLMLNTALGDDTSVSDSILVNGNTSGNTFVQVNNIGGKGSQTVEGIRIVEVLGRSDGTFMKYGRIVAGAYDYNLEKKGNDWFLTSLDATQPVNPTPPVFPTPPVKPVKLAGGGMHLVRPEAGSYTANLAAANTMFITRLYDRQGETHYTDVLTGEKKVTSLWLRQVGGHNTWKDSTGQLDTQSNRYTAQLGTEVAQLSSDGLQRLHLGVMAGYGHNSSNTHSDATGYNSEGYVAGYSAGVYATWYQNDETKQGPYLDSWLQYGSFNNHVKGHDLQEESYKSGGITASLESGYTHKLGEFAGSQTSLNEWYIQPQAQAVWMGVEADEHRESNGTRVSGEGKGNLQTRLGGRTYQKGHSKLDAGKNRSFEPFVEVNWIHNTQDFGTRMDGIGAYQAGSRNIGEIKTGVKGQINQHLNVWGNVGTQVGDRGYDDTSVVIGMRYNF